MTTDEIFQACINAILEHEGGLTDDPKDPGGITNWGISLRFMLEEDANDHPSAEFIKNLTKAEAIEIYRKYWWDRYRYAEFTQLMVIEKLFDMAVNMGPITAHKILQQAIDMISTVSIQVDGIIGNATISQANLVDGDKLREQLRIGAKDRYLAIIENNPTMERFKTGWLLRAAW